MIKLFPNTRTLIEIGPFSIAWYAVLIMVGAFIAYALSKRNLIKVGYKKEDIEDLFMGSLLAGFAGARLWYVLFSNLGAYLANPLKIFAIWEGGLAIQGGLIAGVAFGYWFAKKRHMNFWQSADLIIPNILIAQAIGRWGNFMNQEAFGNVVPASFYNAFPEWFKNMMYIQGQYRQPTFLYESVANLIGWALIVLVLKRFSKIKRGDLTFAYLMWYGLTRFFIEGMRTDSLMFGPIRMAQLTSVVFMAIGVIGYLGGFKKFIKKEKPIILFDFDGTIADTEACIVATFKKVLEVHKPDLVLSDDTFRSFVGPTLHQTFSNYFSEGEIDAIIKDYRRINHELHKETVREIPNAKTLITSLRSEGYRLGIVSNKGAESLAFGIDVVGFNPDDFEVILGGDQFEPAKPDPAGINLALEMMSADRGSLIYVGDTVGDVKAGVRAGSFTVGVAFDKIREKELTDAGANRVIDNLLIMNEILKEDHEWTITMM